MLTKSRLTKLFAEYDFRPLKRFGENYLIDGNVKDMIIAAAGVISEDTVLEIGPGLGALTMDLAASWARLVAVEKDRKAFEMLTDLIGDEFPNIRLVNGDILDFDLTKMADRGRIKVVGNLPYYITTPIIEYIIRNKDFIVSALLTVQREVANRLLAGPGTKDYSSISCFVRYHTDPEYIHTIKRGSFYPVPDVDSSLIRLRMRDTPPVDVSDEELFFRVVRGAFNQRRKSIVNSLSRKAVLDMPKEKLAPVLKGAGIDPSIRPESLSLSDFANITNAIA